MAENFILDSEFVKVNISVADPTPVSIVEVLGPRGPQGPRGSYWFEDAGPPGDISGQIDGDWYLDISTGNTYHLIDGIWELQGSIRGPQGEDSGGEIFSEVLSGTQDGSNAIFPLAMTAKFPTSIQVFRNGLMEVYGIGFTATSNHITFTSPPLDSDVISLSYQI